MKENGSRLMTRYSKVDQERDDEREPGEGSEGVYGRT